MTEYEEIAERVEASEYGKQRHWQMCHAIAKGIAYKEANEDGAAVDFVDAALKGSLDAAKTLHDAVLPGWHVDIHIQDGFNNHVVLSTDKPLRHINGRAQTPASAWVAAILRAKASMEEGK